MSSIPRQSIVSLPLPPELRSKLLSAGFRTTADLAQISPVSLSKEAQISAEEALEVLKVSTSKYLDGWNRSAVVSATDLFKVQTTAKRIITFCSELDGILGGGVCSGQVTEFCGVPGIGKTQLGMQLAVDVQIPVAFGGVGGKAVYVDTEGSFMVDRAADIAAATVNHIRLMAQRRPHLAAELEAMDLTVDSMLDGIYYFRIHDSIEQVALVNMLDQFLQVHPEVKVIIIDSITFHFRQDFKDMAHRTRVLTQMAQDLMAVAERHALAVVMMNQVTTKVMDEQDSKLIPALGESWGHAATTRVILYWRDNERYAHVYKSPCLPPSTAHYLVTQDGIRGVRPNPAQERQSSEKRTTPEGGFD